MFNQQILFPVSALRIRKFGQFSGKHAVWNLPLDVNQLTPEFFDQFVGPMLASIPMNLRPQFFVLWDENAQREVVLAYEEIAPRSAKGLFGMFDLQTLHLGGQVKAYVLPQIPVPNYKKHEEFCDGLGKGVINMSRIPVISEIETPLNPFVIAISSKTVVDSSVTETPVRTTAREFETVGA